MSRERERLEEVTKKIKRESNHHPSSSSGLNTITPCAACKLLRRRCAQECPFSPYFSPHDPQRFAAVHRVFGASNVSKMLSEVPESQRAAAANTIVYEANVRLRDPVYGCMGAVSKLQHQVQVLTAELSVVRAEILRFKYNNNNMVIDDVHVPFSYDNLAGGGDGVVSVAVPPPPAAVAHTSSHSMYSSPPGAPDFSSISDDNDIPFYG